MCFCFIEWQKTFDRVDWAKLLEMRRNTGVNWKERRPIRNLYMGQRVKLHLNQGETDSVKIGRGVRQGCCMSSILFNTYGEYLMKEALAEVEGFKIWRRIMNKVRFADDTAIIAKTQKALQDSVNRLVDTGRKYGMEINIDKSQVVIASRSNESLQIKVNNR
jgi:Reverse transcriptase (RNA-dependent DNA polymerase).